MQASTTNAACKTSIANRLTTALPFLIIIVMAFLVSHPSWRNQGVDDLDSAHHLMDGYFFRDLFVDHPSHALRSYLFNYYKQYPALGFVFWPPFIPAVFGAFCIFGGPHVLVIRACMFGFGLLFSASYYSLLRRQYSKLLSLIGVLALMAVPGMIWSFNEVMLELPTLAMMCVAALAYFTFTDRIDESGAYIRSFGLALACAAVIYSKQPGWFLYCAFAFHFLVCHRIHIRRREVWFAVALTILLCTPLLIFTLYFGRANLGQSIGNSTNHIMAQYKSIPRWSWAAWTYYPRLAPSLLNPAIVLATLAGLLISIRNPKALRANALWISWFFFAYLTFSYYDNRLPRHATFWWPAWIALALAGIHYVTQSFSLSVRMLAAGLILVPVPMEIRAAWRSDYTDYNAIQEPIARIFSAGQPGNVLVFGQDQQVLTAVIREHDTTRAVHVVRGTRLLASDSDLQRICKLYRIGTLLVEDDGNSAQAVLAAVSASPNIKLISRSTMLRRGTPVAILQFHYTGPIDLHMADVVLSNRLTD